MRIPKYVMETMKRNERLLLAAATALAEAAAETMEIRDPECDDGEPWRESTRLLLLEIADYLPYEALAVGGTLTPLGQNIASLEGWSIMNGGDGVCGEIQRDDMDGFYASDDAAVDHVKACAKSEAPGTKLHAIALAIHTNDGKRPFRASSRHRKRA